MGITAFTWIYLISLLERKKESIHVLLFCTKHLMSTEDLTVLVQMTLIHIYFNFC